MAKDLVRLTELAREMGAGVPEALYEAAKREPLSGGRYIFACRPGRTAMEACRVLTEHGYGIRIFCPGCPECSDPYSPVPNVRTEEGVRDLAGFLTGGAGHGADAVTEAAGEALLTAIILYLVRYRPEKDQTLPMISKLLAMAAPPKNGDSKLDGMFNAVRGVDPDDPCVRAYGIFLGMPAAAREAGAALASARLMPYASGSLGRLFEKDGMRPSAAWEPDEAAFIIVPSSEGPEGAAAGMLFSQLIGSLYMDAAADGIRRMLEYRDGKKEGTDAWIRRHGGISCLFPKGKGKTQEEAPAPDGDPAPAGPADMQAAARRPGQRPATTPVPLDRSAMEQMAASLSGQKETVCRDPDTQGRPEELRERPKRQERAAAGKPAGMEAGGEPGSAEDGADSSKSPEDGSRYAIGRMTAVIADRGLDLCGFPDTAGKLEALKQMGVRFIGI